MLKKISSIYPVIGIGLFIYIIYKTGLTSIFSVLARVNVFYMIVFVPVFVALITLIRSYKWQLLIRSLGVQYGWRRSIQVTLIGFFVGFITPGRIGDIARSFYLRNDTKLALSASISTVFVDRLLDLMVVLVLGMFSILLFSQYYSSRLFYSLISIAVVLFFGLYITTKKRTVKALLRPLYKKIIPLKYKAKLSKGFNTFYESVFAYKKNKKLLFTLLVINIINWFVIFTFMYVIAIIIGLSVSFYYILLIAPIIVLVEIIPISIGGIGTREAAIVFLLSFVNIDSVLAVSYSLVYMVLAGWTFAMVGAVLWLKEPIKIKDM